MSIAITFAVFITAMAVCVAAGFSLIYALAVTVLAFALLARHRGFSFREIFAMTKERLKETMIILKVFFFIGIMTGLWRSCGTISFFVYYGIKLVTPPLFLLISFLLPALMSFTIGTAFGTAATAGTILIAMARFGGVSEIMTAGAILAGSFFGDRCSPASSSASLVAAVTKTDLYSNIRTMLKTAALPFGLSVVFYGVLSVLNPISGIDTELLQTLHDGTDLSFLTIIPAALMLILPALHVSVRRSMLASVAASFLLTVFLQHTGVSEALKICVLGYSPQSEALSPVLSGGGLISMLSTSVIITLTGITTGIIEGAGILDPIQKKISVIADRLGLFPTLALISAAISAILCNQTVAIMMSQQIMGGIYADHGRESRELAADIANSAVIIAPLIPWCIACSVPLSTVGVGPAAILFAFYLYALPVCYGFTKRLFFGKKVKARPGRPL